MELAREFSIYGEIAVIDLNAALGNGENEKIIKELARSFDIRVGGLPLFRLLLQEAR